MRSYGFHGHFRPMQACSPGHALGDGRARLAPRGLGLQAFLSWLTRPSSLDTSQSVCACPCSSKVSIGTMSLGGSAGPGGSPTA